MKEDCVIERRTPGCDWALFRPVGQGVYFHIALISGDYSVPPMICLRDVSRNYFKCRSLAIRMYDAFVAGLPKR